MLLFLISVTIPCTLYVLLFLPFILVLTSVTPASSAPVLQTSKATASTVYFVSLTVKACNGGFVHCIKIFFFKQKTAYEMTQRPRYFLAALRRASRLLPAQRFVVR